MLWTTIITVRFDPSEAKNTFNYPKLKLKIESSRFLAILAIAQSLHNALGTFGAGRRIYIN